LKGKAELRDIFLKNKIKIHEDLFMKNIIQKIILFSKSIYKNKPDVIHAHLPESELITRFSFRFNAKFIITRHFGGQFYPRSQVAISSILGKIASKPASAVIAISESVIINLINNREIYDNKKIKLVYYGFSRTEFLRETTLNNPYAPTIQDKIIIGTVSRLSPEKDLATLIKAFHILIKKLPNLELHIVGEGELKDSLKYLCDKLKLNRSVKFFGKRPDIAYFMSTLSVFVLPSKYEGFGMVLLEAISFGLPCISFDCPSGPRDIIKNNENGMLIENYDNVETNESFEIIVPIVDSYVKQILKLSNGKNGHGEARLYTGDNNSNNEHICTKPWFINYPSNYKSEIESLLDDDEKFSKSCDDRKGIVYTAIDSCDKKLLYISSSKLQHSFINSSL
jgi:glycosyltransferase involved in cell wall biosynthesis